MLPSLTVYETSVVLCYQHWLYETSVFLCYWHCVWNKCGLMLPAL